jgi:3-oxoacyl-[acyl-carrier protein] reductase
MNKKHVMLITGTSRGIGKYLTEHYTKKFIVIGCSRKESNYSSSNYVHFCMDVSDEKKVKEIFNFIRKKYGRLDYLVNNAGKGSMNHSLLMPVGIAKDILETNVLGTFLFTREAAKIMKNKKFGRIVNFVSFAIPFKLEGEAVYAASKAAIVSLTQILSREYADFGITVNAVAPPATQTDLIKGVPDTKMNLLLKRQAIHRYGNLNEISHIIDFLIDEKSEMVTGQIIYMGGV